MTPEYPSTVIHNPVLAESIAYAMKPDYDLAAAALAGGSPDKAAELRAQGDTAGTAYGFAVLSGIESSMAALLAAQTPGNATASEQSPTPRLGFLSEISPGDELATPRIGTGHMDVVARTVAALVALPPGEQSYTNLQSATGISRAALHAVVDGLSEAGLVVEDDTKLRRRSTTAGRRPMLYTPTELLADHIRRVPDWRAAYNAHVMTERIRELSKQLGKDEVGTGEFLTTISAFVLATSNE